MVYNNEPLQAIESDACGHYCIVFGVTRSRGDTFRNIVGEISSLTLDDIIKAIHQQILQTNMADSMKIFIIERLSQIEYRLAHILSYLYFTKIPQQVQVNDVVLTGLFELFAQTWNLPRNSLLVKLAPFFHQ